jgi:thiamine-monophosphate kinase
MPEGEFEFIAKRLRPLAAGTPGALGLIDDAALLDPPEGAQLVLTKDAMVAGVHFLADDPASQIGQKLLRVNLSDLAAMGAEPLGYLLSIARRRDTSDEWLESFCLGLAEDQAEFGIGLLGGDTLSTPGPLSLSLTAVGRVPHGQALLRSTAEEGDDLYVSGTLGDGALGLKVLQGELSPNAAATVFLADRYRRPQPRLGLGQALRGVAHAAIDISDGLLADLGHILDASDLGAEVRADRLPLSIAARELPDAALEAALAGGDDYELLFTAPADKHAQIEQISKELELPLTQIGRLDVLPGLRVLDAHGQPIHPERTGWTHF